MGRDRANIEENYMNYSHSYIIEYPNGDRRDELLTREIKNLLKTDRNVGPYQHEDVHYMTSTGKLGYKVVDVDQFIKSLKMMPHGNISVGVIDDADLMSEIAQNKLLKTIEEPTDMAVIFLVVSNRQRLLSTIRSRCKVKIYGSYENYRDENKEPDLVDDAVEKDKKLNYLSKSFFELKYFYQFRNSLDKEVEDKDFALRFIDEIEKNLFEYYLEDASDTNYPYLIGKCEDTRIDIMNGMGFKQALKRLFLLFH